MSVPAQQCTSGERGSAVAEFVMITTLLIAISLALVQLALALHVRNTLVDAAVQGAHYGALANREPADAAARARQLVSQSLTPSFARDITVRTRSRGGEQVVEVTVRTRVPLTGLLPNGWDLEAHGTAVRYE